MFPEVAQIERCLKGEPANEGNQTCRQVRNLEKRAVKVALRPVAFYNVGRAEFFRVLIAKAGARNANVATHGECAHPSRDSTLAAQWGEARWPRRMTAGVMDFLQKCASRRRSDPEMAKTAPLMCRISYEAPVLAAVAVGLERKSSTANGGRWIMVVVDSFSKCVITGAIKD